MHASWLAIASCDEGNERPVLAARRSDAGGAAVVSANHVDLTLKYKEGFLYHVTGALESALVERKARIAEVPPPPATCSPVHLSYWSKKTRPMENWSNNSSNGKLVQ